MDRKQFCQLMADVRKQNPITTTDLSFAIKMLLPTLRRFEKGEHNFKIDKAIQYLHILGYRITLLNKGGKYTISTYVDIINFLKQARKNNFTQRDLALKVGCSYVTIANIERQSNIISIDLFLKLVDALAYNIKIEKI